MEETYFTCFQSAVGDSAGRRAVWRAARRGPSNCSEHVQHRVPHAVR